MFWSGQDATYYQAYVQVLPFKAPIITELFSEFLYYFLAHGLIQGENMFHVLYGMADIASAPCFIVMYLFPVSIYFISIM